MILNIILLGGVLGVGYRSWREQKKQCNVILRNRQRQTTTYLKANKKKGNEPRITRAAKARTSKDMVSLVAEMCFSSVGYWSYHPL